MQRYQWAALIALFGCMVFFSNCTKVEKESKPIESSVSDAEQVDKPIVVMIYSGGASWITLENASYEAEQTKKLLKSNGIQVEITSSEEILRNWMTETTGNGVVNVCILYGVLPSSIYPSGNTLSDGSVIEKWIETTDGDTILNHADYLGYYSADGTPNYKAPLQNLMDLPDIDINVEYFERLYMDVTDSGKTLTPNLVAFKSDRPFPLEQLGSAWYAEKVFASDTGDVQCTLADPVILRDGERGRLAMVHQTHHGDNPKGVVAAEIIINYLLAK